MRFISTSFSFFSDEKRRNPILRKLNERKRTSGLFHFLDAFSAFLHQKWPVWTGFQPKSRFLTARCRDWILDQFSAPVMKIWAFKLVFSRKKTWLSRKLQFLMDFQPKNEIFSFLMWISLFGRFQCVFKQIWTKNEPFGLFFQLISQFRHLQLSKLCFKPIFSSRSENLSFWTGFQSKNKFFRRVPFRKLGSAENCSFYGFSAGKRGFQLILSWKSGFYRFFFTSSCQHGVLDQFSAPDMKI